MIAASSFHRTLCSTMVFLLLVGLTSCSLFSTRTPEDPETEGGTFFQPDTPEQVIDNIAVAISEMNTLNYRRSFAADLTFLPTATAQARESVFANWGRPQEEQYFSALAAASSINTGHGIVFNDRQLNFDTESRYTFFAKYVLTARHNRTDAMTEVQGLLEWVIVQGSNGLWEVREWTDQEFESFPSWSDMKAKFIN